MITPLDNYYMQLDEPYKGCMMALRDIILSFDEEIVQEYSWKLPFFKYRSKMFCYLNINKKTKLPYVSFYKGPDLGHIELEREGRKMFSVWYVDPTEDIDVDCLLQILTLAKEIHQ